MGRRSKIETEAPSVPVASETPPATAAAPTAVEQVLAGPFALHPHHREIWRSAAQDKSRYTCNAVALLPDVPGLVATDGHILAMLPLQALDEKGEPGPYGNNFRGHRHKDLILLPLEVVKSIPKRLDYGVSHLELTIVQVGDLRYAVRREVPYGNTHRFIVPSELVDGEFPHFASLIPAWKEREPVVAAAFDPDYVADLAKAIGDPGTATLVVFEEDGAAVMIAGGEERAGVTKRRARKSEPEGWQGVGVLMPMTLKEHEHESAADMNARLKYQREARATKAKASKRSTPDAAEPAA